MRTFLGDAPLLLEMIHPNGKALRHASLNQDRGEWGKRGEPPRFFCDELFPPSTVLRDSFSIVHDPLLVVHQLWNEVSKASAGFQESEAFAS